jgi:hypothetical protein
MVTQGYSRYRIDPFWDKEYCNLNYIQEPFNDETQLAEWQDLGYKNVSTGYMCDMRSSQPSWNDRFIKLYNNKRWKDIGTSYYRMDAGTILPMHGDLYKKYVELFNLKGQEHYIRRAIVFLEPWSSGHYLEIAGDVITQWQAGEVIEWAYDAPHIAANVGITPRYTLQITGHV